MLVSTFSFSQENMKDKILILKSNERNISKNDKEIIFKFPSKAMFRYSKKKHSKKYIDSTYMLPNKIININDYRKNVKIIYKENKITSLYKGLPFITYIYVQDKNSCKKGIIYEVEELVLIENEIN